MALRGGISPSKGWQTNWGSGWTSGRKWRCRRRRRHTTTVGDDDDNDDEDEDEDDDERRLARHAHVVGASAAATTAELRGCLPRRTAPGGLHRLRHPTSPAILHRACASKAAYTPPPTLSLPFLSLLLPLISSRTVVSPANPRFTPLVVYPPRYLPVRAHFEGHTLRFVESAFRGSLLDSSAKGKEVRSLVLHRRYRHPPFSTFFVFPPAPPFSVIAFPFVFLSCAVCLRALALLVLTRFLFIPLRGFVSVISTMETRNKLERRNVLFRHPARATVVN